MRTSLSVICGLLLCLSGTGAFPAAPPLDTVLKQLKQGAIQKSPDINIAQESVRQKRAQVLTSWARWLPRLDLQLSQNVRRDYSLLSNGTLPAAFQNFVPPQATFGEWAFNASLPLYRRSVHLNVEMASRESALAESQLGQLLGELDWRLRELFGKYLLSRYRVEALAAALAVSQANLKDTRTRFDLGERTRMDMLRAEANLTSLQSRRLQYDQERQTTRSALLEFSGLSGDAPELESLERLLGAEGAIAVVIDDFSRLEPVMAKLDPYLAGESGPDRVIPESVRARLAQRLAESGPGFQAVTREAQVSDTRAKQLMVSEWPQLDVQGSLYKLSHDWGQLFESGRQSYVLGIVLTIPLFSGGSLFTTAREQAAAATAARLRQEKDQLHLRHEVESQWLQIKALQRQLEAFRLSAAQNEEIVKLSTKSYQLGKESEVDLLSSQNQWMESKISVAQTKIDLSVLARRFAANLGVELP